MERTAETKDSAPRNERGEEINVAAKGEPEPGWRGGGEVEKASVSRRFVLTPRRERRGMGRGGQRRWEGRRGGDFGCYTTEMFPFPIHMSHVSSAALLRLGSGLLTSLFTRLLEIVNF